MSRPFSTRELVLDVLDVFLKLCLTGFLLLALLAGVLILYTNYYLRQPATGLGGVGIGNGNGSLQINVWISNQCPKSGDIITVRGTATNKTLQPRVFELSGKPVFDLQVADRYTRTATRWSDGKALTPDLTRLELEPSQSKIIEMKYTVPNSGDLYNATANLDYSSLFPNAMYKFNDVASATVSFAGPHGCSIIDLP